MLFPAKMPWLLKKLFPNYVWDFFSKSKNSSKKVLYLTFDDGPVPEATEYVLEELKNYNAKATFFCIGDNVEKHADIFKKVIEGGHAIGNHTQHHVEGWNTSTQNYIDNTLEAQQIIDKHLKKIQTSNSDSSDIKNRQSKIVNLFRPPYGRIKRSQGKQLRKLGYNIIMWDVVGKDWRDDVSEEDCLKNVIDNTVNGSIIVLHDSLKALKNVKFTLPKMLEYFSSKGYRFEKIEL